MEDRDPGPGPRTSPAEHVNNGGMGHTDAISAATSYQVDEHLTFECTSLPQGLSNAWTTLIGPVCPIVHVTS